MLQTKYVVYRNELKSISAYANLKQEEFEFDSLKELKVFERQHSEKLFLFYRVWNRVLLPSQDINR